MQLQVKAFPSYILALAYAVRGAGPNYFECLHEADGNTTRRAVEDWITQIPPEQVTADIASTVAAYAMRDDRITGTLAMSNRTHGAVLTHYTEDGAIVRFVAIRMVVADAEVRTRGHLPEMDQAYCKQPWAIVYPNGYTRGCASESEALNLQAAWRADKGLSVTTGKFED